MEPFTIRTFVHSLLHHLIVLASKQQVQQKVGTETAVYYIILGEDTLL